MHTLHLHPMPIHAHTYQCARTQTFHIEGQQGGTPAMGVLADRIPTLTCEHHSFHPLLHPLHPRTVYAHAHIKGCTILLDTNHQWISNKSVLLRHPLLYFLFPSPFLFPSHLRYSSIHPHPPCLTLRPYVPCFTDIRFHATMILSPLA